ncbi:MAG TPA: VOC family protein [Trebonia sp.]|nr:VOC family protein [Trebonia sp.]
MSDAAMDFLHIGMKVHDIERATRCYAEAFGVVWEPVREYQLSHITLEGDAAPSRTLVTHGHTSQGFEIEMVQGLEGTTADDLVLDGREGVSHIAFTVDNLDTAIADATERGLRLVSEYRSEQVDFAFFDGDDLGGVLAQLVHFKQPRPTDGGRS